MSGGGDGAGVGGAEGVWGGECDDGGGGRGSRGGCGEDVGVRLGMWRGGREERRLETFFDLFAGLSPEIFDLDFHFSISIAFHSLVVKYKAVRVRVRTLVFLIPLL